VLIPSRHRNEAIRADHAAATAELTTSFDVGPQALAFARAILGASA
jgi:hypothetical protein